MPEYLVSTILGSRIYHLDDPRRSRMNSATGRDVAIMLCGLDGYGMTGKGNEEQARDRSGMRLCRRCEKKRAILAKAGG